MDKDTKQLIDDLTMAAHAIETLGNQLTYLAADVEKGQISQKLGFYVFSSVFPVLRQLWDREKVDSLRDRINARLRIQLGLDKQP